MNSCTLSLHWSCLCWRCYHPYIWSAPNRQCPPINAFAAILGFKLSWPNTKLKNVGTGDPPLTILIDDVPVEGVEAFIYFGSKQILMDTADQMFYAGLDLPVQWWILYRGYGIAVLSVSAPKYTCTALSYRNIDPLGRQHLYRQLWRLSTWGVSDRYLMYAGWFMYPMQRCFSDLVCQPLVTSYVIDAYLCLAMLHAWTLEYQHMMDALCLRRQKANGQLEKNRLVALAKSGSTRFRRMPTFYCYLRSGDLRSPGVTKGLNPLVHSVLLKGRYKKLDVRKSHSIFIWKMSHISHQRSLATELCTFYLENKSHALMG